MVKEILLSIKQYQSMYRYYLVRVLSILVLVASSTVFSYGQISSVTVSGVVKDKINKVPLPFVNIVLKTELDSVFVTGTVTNEEGRFSLTGVKPNNYYLEITYIGYVTHRKSLYVGSLSEFLNVPNIELQEEVENMKRKISSK